MKTETAPSWTITPLGDTDLLVEFGDAISEATNRQVHAAAQALKPLRQQWDIEIIPAYTSLAVNFRAVRRSRDDDPFEALQRAIHATLSGHSGTFTGSGRIIDIPVCYGGEYGPDLDDVAQCTGLSPDEVIRLHSAETQLIFMLGFAPGQPVIGLSDERLSLPRRSTPRLAVPACSVAIANRQTVVYSMAVPGGWHLIGRTPMIPFQVDRDPLCLFQPSDRVRFRPIEPDEFQRIEASHEH